MVAVVLADDRLLTWRASTDDAKAVLWDAAGGRVVAALQPLENRWRGARGAPKHSHLAQGASRSLPSDDVGVEFGAFALD